MLARVRISLVSFAALEMAYTAEGLKAHISGKENLLKTVDKKVDVKSLAAKMALLQGTDESFLQHLDGLVSDRLNRKTPLLNKVALFTQKTSESLENNSLVVTVPMMEQGNVAAEHTEEQAFIEAAAPGGGGGGQAPDCGAACSGAGGGLVSCPGVPFDPAKGCPCCPPS